MAYSSLGGRGCRGTLTVFPCTFNLSSVPSGHCPKTLRTPGSTGTYIHTRPQHNFLNPSGLGFCLVHVQLMVGCPCKHASSAAACKSASMMRRDELATAQSAPCPSGASAGNGPASHASVFHQLSGPTSHNMDWKLQCSVLFWLVAQRLSQKSGSPHCSRRPHMLPICSPF